MVKLFEKMLRAGEGRTLRRLESIAKQANALESDFSGLSDTELREETAKFKERLAAGETVDGLLPEAFAAVREASSRTINKRHFDVQIMGGAALHQGNVAEMRTGEGKTLVATLPSYLNALTGEGVHVVTVNDYLAQYQSELMGRVHRALGLETGCILSSMTPAQRREEYAKDITYGTNNEFGFDYLRDNMGATVADMVQRGHHFAIVDEVDSILIDEARTPLIISGPADKPTKWYQEFASLVQRLNRGEDGDGDYEVDEKKRTVGVLESGIEKVEDYLGIDNLYESANTPLIGYLNNAIKAKELYQADKDYVNVDGQIMIVDEHTGRMLAGRRYNEGMHQAIEAKEGVEIKNENQTLATVTLQNYFRMYDRLSGMTGTAQTEAAELHQIYKVGVISIPTNREMIRADQADLVYRTEEAKFTAVVEDIAGRNAEGQPILVGTTSVAKSEYLSEHLRRRGIAHEVLNAKHHAREATIVAEAGRKGSVTVATNMAGRGTDIMLGGNPEFMAVADLKQRGLDPHETPEEYEEAWDSALERAERAVEEQHDEVTQLGGLYVLGTERHESRRIDNQLRGRAGRQGDPGESRFYLSLEDQLMRLFNAPMVDRVMQMANLDDESPIESKMVSRSIASAQSQVEGQHFETRKNVLKYDDVLNRQREVIYEERRQVVEGADLHEQIRMFINDVVGEYVRTSSGSGFVDEMDLDAMLAELASVYPVGVTASDIAEAAGGEAAVTPQILVEQLTSDAQHAYDRRESDIGEELMRDVERRVLLQVLDRKWREHLYEMDYLKEGIGLRAMAQREPLVEYQREGFQLFTAMMESIKEEGVRLLFNAEIKVTPEQTSQMGADGMPSLSVATAAATAGSAGSALRSKAARLTYSAPSEDGSVTQREVNADGTSGPSSEVKDAAGDGNRAERRRAGHRQRKH